MNEAHLKTLKGAEFDKAYVDHEVTYHQQVLDAVDKTLIPGAKNEELKALLVKVRAGRQRERGQPGAAHTVVMDATAFMPPTMTVKVGDRVTWVNHDPFAHDVSSAQGGFSSKIIAPDASWTFRPMRKGTFPASARCTRR